MKILTNSFIIFNILSEIIENDFQLFLFFPNFVFIYLGKLRISAALAKAKGTWNNQVPSYFLKRLLCLLEFFVLDLRLFL